MQNNFNNNQQAMVPGEHSTKEIFKFGLVITGILAVSLFLSNTHGPSSLENWTRWFMGVFFLVFAGFKLIGYRIFVLMFAGYDIVAKRFRAYGFAYPFIELALAALYLFDLLLNLRDVLTVIILGVGSIGVVQEIKKRSGVHCACLGNVIKLPLSTTSFVEDAGMGLMALAMLFAR